MPTGKSLRPNVGIDEDGHPITSCVVEYVEGAATAKKGKSGPKSKSAKIALAALLDAIEECGEIPPASNHIPANAKAVKVETWKTYALKAGLSNSDNESTARMAMKRAHESLVADKFVGCWMPWVWPAS